MGLSELFADFVSAVGFTEVQAEAPPAEEETPTPAPEAEEEAEEAPAEEEQEEEEEEEEEEEPEDIQPQLEQECANSKQCAPYKHHFDECVERVTRNSEDPDFKGPHEDCVEEFFHLQHCATQCAAPKLWAALK
ncbi:predicted protein [Uncinocarpus reesii 1704]|uniref:Cytochrome b-c1 complex subunit 6, mitochondrial n=1 Tax=Uncinocarpus reesii (strain UAMH 1704) TaxID=336963 RepID=C4JS33_UNCRE|nr:uncharacterized protein UREG_05272 [Uncinocarpus reesii 1704]EEP80430.1 predicted protein [Uncinocarpus reesii 1704]